MGMGNIFSRCDDETRIENGHNLPKPYDFLSVQCRDISSGGISFYLSQERPGWIRECELIVIRLAGTGVYPKYLTARVRRVTLDESEGAYVVGCQFLSPLHRDAALEALLRRRET